MNAIFTPGHFLRMVHSALKPPVPDYLTVK